MKRMALLWAAVMLVAFVAGCSNPAAEGAGDIGAAAPSSSGGGTATGEGTGARTYAEKLEPVPDQELYLGASITTLASEYFKQFQEEFEAMCTERDISYVIQSAEMSSIKQIEQIENMVEMGVNAMVVWAVDGEALADVLKQVREQGIYVVTVDGKPMYDRGAADTWIDTNQWDYGMVAAELAAEWIETQYPDAQPGSIEVCMVTSSFTEYWKERREAFYATLEAGTDKAVVVGDYDYAGDTPSTKSQEYAELMLIEHPGVKVVICNSMDCAMAVDEVFMRNNVDTGDIAVFGVDWVEAGARMIQSSLDGESTLRGLSMRGQKSPAYVPFYLLTREFQPDPETHRYPLETWGLTPENAEELIAWINS